MVTAAEAQQHHTAVVARQRRDLYAIDAGTFQPLNVPAQQSILHWLDPELEIVNGNERYRGELTGMPTPGHILIAKGLVQLRREQDTTRRQELARFLGHTLLPLVNVQPGEDGTAGTISEVSPWPAGCSRAETYFAGEALRQYQQGRPIGPQPLLRSYHNVNGQVLAFGKQYRQPSAMLVGPVTVDIDDEALTLPPGTIVYIDDASITNTIEKSHGEWWSVMACQLNDTTCDTARQAQRLGT